MGFPDFGFWKQPLLVSALLVVPVIVMQPDAREKSTSGPCGTGREEQLKHCVSEWENHIHLTGILPCKKQRIGSQEKEKGPSSM